VGAGWLAVERAWLVSSACPRVICCIVYWGSEGAMRACLPPHVGQVESKHGRRDNDEMMQ
jgi:hypothetical protein